MLVHLMKFIQIVATWFRRGRYCWPLQTENEDNLKMSLLTLMLEMAYYFHQELMGYE